MEGYTPLPLPLEMVSVVEHRTPGEWKDIRRGLASKIGPDPAGVVLFFLCTPATVLYENHLPHCSLM